MACTQGCALEFTQSGLHLSDGAVALIEPAVLCAETPEAQIGDACGSAVFKCLPSRAQLNPNGTVARRNQLTCGANNQCACLLAWDETSTTMHSGVTRQCLGDWQCPALALCDTVPNLESPSGALVAGCKPGPRGVLTPEMLTPP